MSRKQARFERRLAARRAGQGPEQPEDAVERREQPPLIGEALEKRLRELNIAGDRRGPYRKRIRQP